MCRPNALGGRRCPSHTDPTFVANRNARRRAQYASKKNITSETVMRSFFPDGYKTHTAKELLTETSTIKHDELGVTVTNHSGAFIDMNYLSAKHLTGVINHTNLNETSYQTFGFKPPSQHEEIHAMTAMELSKKELKDHTIEEKAALHFFSSNRGYEWVNEALYGIEPVNPSQPDEKKYFQKENLEFVPDDTWVNYHNETEALLKETVGYLDSALKKAVHVPRVVYRGVRATSKTLKGLSPKEWVEKNLRLGSEMVFDAYQSTTLKQSNAGNFSRIGGIIYEILTPEGVNMSSISGYASEAEVLLPRKSRYMVVGMHDEETIGKKPVTVIQMVAVNEKGEALNFTTRHEVPPLTDEDYTVAEKKPSAEWRGRR